MNVNFSATIDIFSSSSTSILAFTPTVLPSFKYSMLDSSPVPSTTGITTSIDSCKELLLGVLTLNSILIFFLFSISWITPTTITWFKIVSPPFLYEYQAIKFVYHQKIQH